MFHRELHSFSLFKKNKLLEEKYGLNYSDRLLLEELGFITANDLAFQMMETKDQPGNSVFTIGDFIVIQEKLPNKPQHQLEVLVFTKIGRQLLNLVNVTPDLDYIQLLASSLNRQIGNVKYGRIIQRFTNGQIRHTPLIDVPLTEKEQEQEKKNDKKVKIKKITKCQQTLYFIAVFVRTTYFTARNNGGGVRQESSPQSATQT